MLTAVLAPVPEEPLPCGPLDEPPQRQVEPILRSLLYRKMSMEDAWQRSREAAPAAGQAGTTNSQAQLEQRQANAHYEDFVDVQTDQGSSTDVSGLSDSPEGSLTDGSAHTTPASAAGQHSTPPVPIAEQDPSNSGSDKSSSTDTAAAGPAPTSAEATGPQPTSGNTPGNTQQGVRSMGQDSIEATHDAAASSQPRQLSAPVPSSGYVPRVVAVLEASSSTSTSDWSSDTRVAANPASSDTGSRPDAASSSNSNARSAAASPVAVPLGPSSSELPGTSNSASALPPQAVLQLLTDVVLEQARDLRRLSGRVDSFLKQQAKSEQEARDAKVARQKERLAHQKRESERRRKGRRRERRRKALGVLMLSASLLFWAHRRFQGVAGPPAAVTAPRRFSKAWWRAGVMGHGA